MARSLPWQAPASARAGPADAGCEWGWHRPRPAVRARQGWGARHSECRARMRDKQHEGGVDRQGWRAFKI